MSSFDTILIMIMVLACSYLGISDKQMQEIKEYKCEQNR